MWLKTIFRKRQVTQIPQNAPKVLSRVTQNPAQKAAQNPNSAYSGRERAILKFHAQTLAVLLFNAGIGVGTIHPARGAKYSSLAVRLTNPMQIDKALKLSEALAVQVSTDSVLALRERGHAVYQVGLHRAMWKTYTRGDLHTPNGIGFAARNRELRFEFTQEAPHAYFVGATGSGKTEGMKTTLYGLMAANTPDALTIAIADPHHDYTDFQNAAHLAAPIAHTPDEMNNLIKWALAQLEERKEANNRNAPKLVVVVDELPTLTSKKENERADYNRAAIDSIANEGRKFNIHLLVGLQRPTKNDLEKKTNFTRRFIGYLPDGNESYILGGQAGLKANALAGQGDFVRIGGQDAKRFQFVMLRNSDFGRLERRTPPPLVIPSHVVEPERLAEAVADSGNGGRPRNEILPEILGLVMANRNVTYPVAREAIAGLTSKRHLQMHKRLWDDALAQFLRVKAMEATK